MGRGRRQPSQSWKAFLRNHAAGIAAVDLLVVPTIGFRLLYVLIILGHGVAAYAALIDVKFCKWATARPHRAFGARALRQPSWLTRLREVSLRTLHSATLVDLSRLGKVGPLSA